MKKMILGIGSETKGDDGIGNIIAREMGEKECDWLSYACETVPENFTSVVERENPDVLIIIDAADMGLKPGEFRIIDKEKLSSDIIGTHNMPLCHLVEYLEKYAKNIIFIGIQPENTELGEELSDSLINAKNNLIKILTGGMLNPDQ